MGDDDRERWTLTFRELGAAELLERYRRRNELPPLAIDALRDELKLRGVDPDSLRATVPRAEPDPDEPVLAGEEAQQGEVRGEMQPPPEFELPEGRTGEVSANVMICPHCQTPNHPESQRCRSCREPLRPLARPAANGDRIAPAVIGLFGVVMIVFALYVLLLGDHPQALGLVSALIGCSAVLASLLLQRGALARG